MEDQPALIDLNTAGLDELRTLPGVGPSLAERILEARPFASFEDVRRVSGIGSAALERLQPLVTLTPVEPSDQGVPTAPEEEVLQEAEPAVSPVGGEMPAIEALSAEVSPLEQVSETSLPPEELPSKPTETDATVGPPAPAPVPAPVTAPKTQSRPASRAEAIWLSLGALILATLFGVALSLGFLALVNGGLSYARPAQIVELNRQVDGLGAQAEILQQDIGALRGRIDNLEALSGRVGAVENAMDGVRTDMDAVQAGMETLNRQVDDLNGAVNELQTRANRFQGFLEGLRKLMEGIFTP